MLMYIVLSILSLSLNRDLYFTLAGSQQIYHRKMNGSSEQSVAICSINQNCTVAGFPNTGGIVAISIDFDPSSLFHDKLVWSYLSKSDSNSESETVTVGYNLYGNDKNPHLINRIQPPPISRSLYFNKSVYYHIDSSSLKISKSFGNGGTQKVLQNPL